MRNTSDSDPPREPLKVETSSETKQGKCCLYIKFYERNVLGCIVTINSVMENPFYEDFGNANQVHSNFLSQL